jgi:hypothetical protein
VRCHARGSLTVQFKPKFPTITHSKSLNQNQSVEGKTVGDAVVVRGAWSAPASSVVKSNKIRNSTALSLALLC